ncbi:Gfo/Idh/MocA family protein [Deinococcus aquaticus]|uniref:Gfo/Idh/MocA family oxidoreductase n=1 Tax=Deinococcus aquaticus TaxID=328692 RepID=A0ABY7V5L4_9DEIO|nr:Gfo/Idh/MocA family oxidoreductase [Deinococcus aquaticus]WDA60375.1 Gfo/Idh/MocA family oxidoreductase [Deinococcus aquaticus]
MGVSASEGPQIIGIIGTGNISAAYLKIARDLNLFRVKAVTDMDSARAAEVAAEYGVQAMTLEGLLADPEIIAVVNLTPPGAHADVSLKALNAGKHVYSEKPLAVEREDGQKIMNLAAAKGLRVGCAPDTVLGAGIQTAREVIDAGRIGRPVAANAFMMGSGPESWHPNPDFFYQRGAGPLFDMGPYYLSALVTLLGGVQKVSATTTKAFEQRPITSQPRAGEFITVNTPTHVAANLTLDGGAVVTLITSFDVPGSDVPRIEIHGTGGTLSVPDPNTFGGPLRIRLRGEKDWTDIPLTRPFADNARGIGLADMLAAAPGQPHRAGGDLALHVLDVMHTILESAGQEKTLAPRTTAERPAPLDAPPAWFTVPAPVGGD